MPRLQIKPRHQDVMITDHAWLDRWPERAKLPATERQLRRKIEGRLTELARSDGIVLDSTGACWVQVYSWLWAVVRLTSRGWLVMTFATWPPREQTG